MSPLAHIFNVCIKLSKQNLAHQRNHLLTCLICKLQTKTRKNETRPVSKTKKRA